MSKKKRNISSGSKSVQLKDDVGASLVVPQKTRISKIVVVLLVVITVVGLCLRIYNLGERALHNDEALQLNGIQTQTFAQLIEHCTHVDMHPPLSYLLEKLVYHYTDTVAALRFVSVVFGVLAIPLLFWALYPLFNRRIAVIASALSAISYELIWYSRELRDYIFFYFFVIAAFGFFVRILQDKRGWPDWRNVVGFTIMNILATYSHFNTYLTWPVYAVLFLLWEFNGRKLVIRWRHIVVLAISAVVILITVAPTFVWFTAMRKVQGAGALRPGISALYEMLAPLGYGNGWSFSVWLMLLIAGIWMGVRRRDKSILILGAWVFIPLLFYIYILGMPPKFIKLFYRYMIFLQLGFITLMACGVEQISLWIVGKKEKLVNYIAGVVILCTVIIMFPVFHAYYGLTATDRLYKEIGKTLKELSPRCLFLDNYYEMQYLRHYLPKGMTVAFPPIFNNDIEYQKLDAHGFTRKALESDAMLIFFDAGNIRRRSRSGRDVKWLDSCFRNKREFVNKNGVYLYKRGLNLFAMHDFDTRVDRIYYNNIDDLPDILSKKNRNSFAYGPEWYGLTVMGFDGKWQFLRVAGRISTLYVYNSNRDSSLSLGINGCVANQSVNILRKSEQLAIHKFVSGPLAGVDLRTRKRFKEYVPLASILKRSKGMVNLPIAINMPIDVININMGKLTKGLNRIHLRSNSADGIVVK